MCKIFMVSSTHENFQQVTSSVCQKMEIYEQACCVRGYHVYQHIWSTAVGGVLSCEREPTNSRGRYAVVVKKDGVAIGHLPRKALRICSLFLRRGSAIHCKVSGGQWYSSDIPQGGLEIPCHKEILLLFFRCKIIFVCKIFVVLGNHEIFLKTKIS